MKEDEEEFKLARNKIYFIDKDLVGMKFLNMEQDRDECIIDLSKLSEVSSLRIK